MLAGVPDDFSPKLVFDEFYSTQFYQLCSASEFKFIVTFVILLQEVWALRTYDSVFQQQIRNKHHGLAFSLPVLYCIWPTLSSMMKQQDQATSSFSHAYQIRQAYFEGCLFKYKYVKISGGLFICFLFTLSNQRKLFKYLNLKAPPKISQFYFVGFLRL